MSKKKAASGRPAKPAPSKAAKATEPALPASNAGATGAGAGPRLPFRRPQSLNFAGVGRNDICPCGSGKRFKNCHGH